MASSSQDSLSDASSSAELNKTSGEILHLKSGDMARAGTEPVASEADPINPVPEPHSVATNGGAEEGSGSTEENVNESSDSGCNGSRDGIDAVQGKVEEVATALQALHHKFDRQIVANRHQEKIIDRLHAELQGYKEGQLRQLVAPILTDLVKLYDDLSMAVNDLPQKKGITVEQAVQSLCTFPSDVCYILERQGLETFAAVPGEKFDPARQRAIKRLPIDDPAADKTVSESSRPGFSWEGKVFRPNFVSVYVYTSAKVADGIQAAAV